MAGKLRITRTIKAFRQSKQEARLLAQISQDNHIRRSTLRVTALLHYIQLLEKQGIITPYEPMAAGVEAPAAKPYPHIEEEGLQAAEEWQAP
ncbi:MAG: hypothetical protein R3Y56_04180 [Akkermansia sp.]